MVGRASPRSLPIRLLTSPHDAIISNRWRSPQANFNTRCDGTASIITASSLVQGLVTPAVYHLRMTQPTILNCAWVQATARGFWVRLLVSPSVRRAVWTARSLGSDPESQLAA